MWPKVFPVLSVCRNMKASPVKVITSAQAAPTNDDNRLNTTMLARIVNKLIIVDRNQEAGCCPPPTRSSCLVWSEVRVWVTFSPACLSLSVSLMFGLLVRSLGGLGCGSITQTHEPRTPKTKT
jgi:hypothetical protein